MVSQPRCPQRKAWAQRGSIVNAGMIVSPNRTAGGLVFKAHRLLYHSTLGLRVINQKRSWRPTPRFTNRKEAIKSWTRFDCGSQTRASSQSKGNQQSCITPHSTLANEVAWTCADNAQTETVRRPLAGGIFTRQLLDRSAVRYQPKVVARVNPLRNLSTSDETFALWQKLQTTFHQG